LVALGEVSRDYLMRSRYFELHTNLQSQTADEIHLKKQAIEAFDYAISFFREQMSVHKHTQQAEALTDPKRIKE